MNAFDATRTLSDAGYGVRNRAAPSRDYPPGTVIAQDPAAGHPVKPGALVTITLANGRPRMIAVPSVLGLLADEAVGVLQRAGFQASVIPENEPPPGNATRAGRVWKQSPIAGSQADEASMVTVSVNSS